MRLRRRSSHDPHQRERGPSPHAATERSWPAVLARRAISEHSCRRLPCPARPETHGHQAGWIANPRDAVVANPPSRGESPGATRPINRGLALARGLDQQITRPPNPTELARPSGPVRPDQSRFAWHCCGRYAQIAATRQSCSDEQDWPDSAVSGRSSSLLQEAPGGPARTRFRPNITARTTLRDRIEPAGASAATSQRSDRLVCVRRPRRWARS